MIHEGKRSLHAPNCYDVRAREDLLESERSGVETRDYMRCNTRVFSIGQFDARRGLRVMSDIYVIAKGFGLERHDAMSSSSSTDQRILWVGVTIMKIKLHFQIRS